MSDQLRSALIEELNDAWLDLPENKNILKPLSILDNTPDQDEFDMKLLWLISQPEYLSFVCKYILNIELLPFQALILKELWTHRFPMLIGSRGLGKATRLDEPIRCKNGWTTMGDVKVGDRVYGGDGRLTTVTHKTEPQFGLNFYRITLRDGRQAEVCEDHLWKVFDSTNKKNGKGEWVVKSTRELYSNYYHIRKDSKSQEPKTLKEYRYALPIAQALMDEESVDHIIHPYVVGVLIGDGSLTSDMVRFTTKDKEVVDTVSRYLPDGYKVNSIPSDPITYSIVMDGSKTPFTQLCKNIGIHGKKAEEKSIPDEYLYTGHESRLWLLKGLMDTDGCSSFNHIEYYTVSPKLAKDVEHLVRSLGFGSRTSIKESWIGDVQYRDCYRIAIYTDQPVFTLKRKLQYTNHVKSKAGRSKYEKSFIVDIEPIGKHTGICITVDNSDSTYLMHDYIVTHNTFVLSLYALLRALLMPGRKIVVAGAAFRQSKFMYEYMESIWKNAPILKDICTAESGPRMSTDKAVLRLNDSSVTCLPIGDGCLSPDTQTTYTNCFGVISSPQASIWGNGKFRDIDYPIDNGVKDTKIVTTKKGYQYEGTYNHAMKVLRNGTIDWVRTDEMQLGDRILIDRSERWHNGEFECTNDEAYALGLMIGDGCWTNKYKLGFATKDVELTNALNKVFDNNFHQAKDKVHWNLFGKDIVANWLKFWGLDKECYTIDKSLPQGILAAPRDSMTSCLQGLFDTDGHLFVDQSRGGTTISVNFTNTSQVLVRQMQYILLHYGIVSTLRSRDRSDKWNTVYELGIYGKNVKIFAEKIGFKLTRKQKSLDAAISQRKTWNSFDDNVPISPAIVAADIIPKISKPDKYSPSKIKRRKTLQQSLLDELLEYCDSPDWADLVNLNIFYDEVTSIQDSRSSTFDVHVPEENEYCANGFFSHNSKIRGQRAADILCDEFASHSKEIFENVIAGFASVHSSPAEKSRIESAIKLGKNKGLSREDVCNLLGVTDLSDENQIVISGTAYYDFNHFADYWRKWKAIIESKGNTKKLGEFFGEDGVPDNFNWRDYSILRIPYTSIPTGFMDEAQIARSKATIHSGIFKMEFMAQFSKDSTGFFKRSLIDACTCKRNEPIQLASGPVEFDAQTVGDPTGRYIIGVDPAAAGQGNSDNFSIVVIEVKEDHRRVVYSWVTSRRDHRERVKKNMVKEMDFYGYCARKIRELMVKFPTIHIAMDAMGGGYAVSEALHDPDKLQPGEKPIWPIIIPGKKQDTDGEPGLHILELCQFAKAEWVTNANHGLRKDLEDRVLLFPKFDPAKIGISIEDDKLNNRQYDTFEDCVMEIEELKTELSIIEVTETTTGRQHWDTPEVKIGVGKKERLKKDRYSALLMANMAAREMQRGPSPVEYNALGGFSQLVDKPKGGSNYIGPDWAISALNNAYGV